MANIQTRLAELQAAAEAKNGNAAENAVASVLERKQFLTKLVNAQPFPANVTAFHRITAIAELNKMEHIYEQVINLNQDNRVLNIIVPDKETKELISQIKDRTGKLVEGETDEE